MLNAGLFRKQVDLFRVSVEVYFSPAARQNRPVFIFFGQTDRSPVRYGGRDDSCEVNRMPEFARPFAGSNIDRMMRHNELIRAVRYTIAAEFEAISL